MSTDPFSIIDASLRSSGLDHFDWIPLKTPFSFEFYKSWIQENKHCDMAYLADSLETKRDPSKAFAPMRSLISVTVDYFPHNDENDTFPLKNLKVAHYAGQQDYHYWFREKLQATCAALQKKFPTETFMAFTDAVPLLERDHAYQAGLGWIGKNTCLIHRKKGSLFFIGEILTTLTTERDPTPTADFCGTCTRCMDACPTGALDTERQLEPQKCIAYWNIEAKTDPPEEIRGKMGDWFFGCDICQTTCPWNLKIHKLSETFQQKTRLPSAKDAQGAESAISELTWVLQTSNKKLMKTLGTTPLARAGGRGLKRNAMIVAANLRLRELAPEIRPYEDHPRLGAIAKWALTTMETPPTEATGVE